MHDQSNMKRHRHHEHSDRHSSRRSGRHSSRSRASRHSRSRSRSPRRHSPSSSKHSHRSHRHRRSRSRSRSKSRSRSHYSSSPISERNARTIFVMQLAARVTSRDLDDFFRPIGKVREVRLIMDNRTRKHKGIAYIEFEDTASVESAFTLNGQKLCGVPILIQHTQAEKNRHQIPSSHNLTQASAPSVVGAPHSSRTCARVYVGSLHYNITEDMLRGVFEPFGRIIKVDLNRDPETGRSRGYGFITFANEKDADQAIEQLNGFVIANRPLRVSRAADRSSATNSTWTSNNQVIAT